jgi:hypothetical protein
MQLVQNLVGRSHLIHATGVVDECRPETGKAGRPVRLD